MSAATRPRHRIKCIYCPQAEHETAAEVRACKDDYDYDNWRAQEDAAVELAGLRALEDRGYEAARAQEWYDMQYVIW